MSQNLFEKTFNVFNMKYFIAAMALSLGVNISASAQTADLPVLDYYEYSLALKVDRSVPNVRVFQSGKVEVNIPFYKKNHGHYELWLNDIEQQRLREMLNPISDINSVELLEQAEAAMRRQSSPDFERSHSSQSRMVRIIDHQDAKSKEWIVMNLGDYARQSTISAEFDAFRRLVDQLKSLQASNKRQKIGEMASTTFTREDVR